MTVNEILYIKLKQRNSIVVDSQDVLIAMKLEEFRRLVISEFGSGLKHATPANVREFLDRMEGEVLPDAAINRFIIDEPSTSYEEVIKDYFTRVLESPPDEAIIALWSLALDLSFAAIELQYSDRFASMFEDSAE